MSGSRRGWRETKIWAKISQGVKFHRPTPTGSRSNSRAVSIHPRGCRPDARRAAEAGARLWPSLTAVLGHFPTSDRLHSKGTQNFNLFPTYLRHSRRHRRTPPWGNLRVVSIHPPWPGRRHTAQSVPKIFTDFGPVFDTLTVDGSKSFWCQNEGADV